MVYQTYQLTSPTQLNFFFLFFVFLSTLCSYSFHWYLSINSANPSPRIEWGHRNKGILLFFFFFGLIGSGVFFFYLLPYWEWLVFSAFITFLYSAPKVPNKYFRILRKIALGKTIFLALVWTHVTVILPILISGQLWKTEFIVYVISRYFLIYAICIIFDYRDREDDKASGVRSLITYLSDRAVTYFFIFSLSVSGVSTLLMLRYNYSLTAVLILLFPGIVTGALYNYARRHFSDMLYYFILDGLMALSALIMLITGI